ncbi:anthrone oxygenase family protein [Herbiconiux sp.]|uniref:anthrone oxygenase family protein n=1 Tax=Herbiconiux sp. TaxID=1871186 RepID=UPI0025B9D1E5|nr:anthrone oxygenase family protein [Herbiconiux sp.]
MSGAELAHALVGVLAAVTGVAAAVVGGVFFAFSSFVMRGLAEAGRDTSGGAAGTGARAGIAAMQAINRTAVRPPFMVLLFGTMLAGLAVCILLAVVGGGHALWWGLAGEVVYLGGVVVMTVAFHVPRNDALAQLDPGGAAAGESGGGSSSSGSGSSSGSSSGSGGDTIDDSWQRYVAEWTRGNHVRTLAGVLAGVLFVMAAFLVGAPLLIS